ncbi:hypothetical protein GCM10009787_47500 [Streptomyces bangladeshensis]|uniref:Uncharacterized protein n=1 Tax=Streptomyces bangladeshensis TaxID=295352 RepID=A0ABP5NJ75_9ACTN
MRWADGTAASEVMDMRLPGWWAWRSAGLPCAALRCAGVRRAVLPLADGRGAGVRTMGAGHVRPDRGRADGRAAAGRAGRRGPRGPGSAVAADRAADAL